jgi:hypothetical protein
VDKTYYRPTDRGKEAVFKAYLEKLAKIREEARAAGPPQGAPAASAKPQTSGPKQGVSPSPSVREESP